ncbi:Trp biosynthesis-associated membrane protein [Actinopolyspora mortivallis]|uniref:Trp biosynthesis-associated membrane protein n=1 Tax=Actinopolyspora mortivallis TaxID=33906 RepID=UPI000379B775|nr:Trp biosynthesis-associated membrane protein [Actinopolyspora mortivallis]
MTGEATGEPRPRRGGLLAVCVIGILASAVGLWAAGSLVWLRQRYDTPFSGESVAEVSGSVVRGELSPLALATLAAIAAVLATGGILRRLIGLVVVAEAVLLGWRLFDWADGPRGVAEIPGTPPGSRPLAVEEVSLFGPALMGASAVVLLVCGLLVLVAARRMPAMGARYSAPRQGGQTRDPQLRAWEDLDEGRDPTIDGDAGTGEPPRD